MNKKVTHEKEVHYMAVSKAIVPLLKDDAARSFVRTLEQSKMKSYSEAQRSATNKKVAEILANRVAKR